VDGGAAFARDTATAAYYESRAAVYDEWYLGVAPEQWQERILNDGSRHRVYKRYLGAEQLAAELGGDVLMAGTWFVAARSDR
jgi:hypothetical protein